MKIIFHSFFQFFLSKRKNKSKLIPKIRQRAYKKKIVGKQLPNEIALSELN